MMEGKVEIYIYIEIYICVCVCLCVNIIYILMVKDRKCECGEIMVLKYLYFNYVIVYLIGK